MNFIATNSKSAGKKVQTLQVVRTIIKTRDCCYDVPLLDSLQSLFKCQIIVNQVGRPMPCFLLSFHRNHRYHRNHIFVSWQCYGTPSTKELPTSLHEGQLYCDGSLFKMHPLFTNNDLALQIALFEVCIGSKAKLYKLLK